MFIFSSFFFLTYIHFSSLGWIELQEQQQLFSFFFATNVGLAAGWANMHEISLHLQQNFNYYLHMPSKLCCLRKFSPSLVSCEFMYAKVTFPKKKSLTARMSASYTTRWTFYESKYKMNVVFCTTSGGVYRSINVMQHKQGEAYTCIHKQLTSRC